MANDVSAAAPKILALGLRALRSACVMPRLVNFDYSPLAALRGQTIDVPIPAPVAAQDVTPSNTPPATADTKPAQVQIPLDQWKEAPFYLTDQDILKASADILPMQASEAVKSIAEAVNSYIFTTFYKDVYGYAGTAGTTPFGATTQPFLPEVTAARKVLAQQLAPPRGERRLVIDPSAEANALGQPQFTNAQVAGTAQGLVEGSLGRKFGFDWYMDQQVPTHTSTPLTAGAATVNGAQAVSVGSTDNGRTGTLSIAKATNTSPLVYGDVISIAGDPQTYVVLANVTLAIGNTSVSIAPALRKATVGGEAITLRASHVVNLAFDRGAYAFAMRPVRDTDIPEVGGYQITMLDDVSGLSLRLEITREHKRYRWSFDALYGGKTVRPEFAARIAG